MSDNKFNIKAWIKRNAVGLIAIVVSIIAISVALVYKQPITADWLGVLVGILSLLVMLLIGWNIYSVIDLNRLKNDTEILNNTIDKEVDKKIKASKVDVTMELMRITHFLIDTKKSNQPMDGIIVAFKTFKSSDDSIWLKSMSREWILGLMTSFIKHNILTESNLKQLKDELTDGEIEFFLSEFLNYSVEEKTERYHGLQELLISLLPKHH